MRTVTLLLATTLLVGMAAVAPTASAFNCDGDPFPWHTEYPTYWVCQQADAWIECLTLTGPCPR